MKQQCGKLGYARSVGLSMQLFAACVQPVGSLASEVWILLPFTGREIIQRAALIPMHLGILKKSAGLRKTTPTDIVSAELHDVPLDHVWLQCGNIVECSSCGMSFLCSCAPKCCCSLKARMQKQGDRFGTPADGYWLHLVLHYLEGCLCA